MKADTPGSLSRQENGAGTGGLGDTSGMSPEQAAEPMAQDRQILSLVRVPNVVLGKILDGGRDGAHAVKLLAIKASKGPGFVLNEHYCRRKYGLSRRAFQAGLAHAKKCGVLEREQHGRCYATEKALDDGSGRFVLIDEALLTRSSSLLAFILAVNLRPDPMRPADAARRIGVKSAATIRKLTQEAVDAGAIAKSVDSRRTVLVARKGYKFDLVKNGPIKNGPVKNDPAHKGMEGSTQKTEVRAQSPEKKLGEHTCLRTGPGLPFRLSGKIKDAENPSWPGNDESGAAEAPSFIILAPWKNSPGIAERDLHATNGPDVFMSLKYWVVWLNAFGRTLGTQVPGHLATQATHQQALDIANELISRRPNNPLARLHRGADFEPARRWGYIGHSRPAHILRPGRIRSGVRACRRNVGGA